MSKRAMITGITGQDGSYSAEFLLGRGREVQGTVRRSSTEKFDRIEHIRDQVTSLADAGLELNDHTIRARCSAGSRR